MTNGKSQASRVSLADEILTPVGVRDGLQLAVKRHSTEGLGKVIFSPDSDDLIADVEIESLPVHPDHRRFFVELGALGFHRYSDPNDSR